MKVKDTVKNMGERGSAKLNVEVTVDISGVWTLEELGRLVDRMSEIDLKIEEEVEKDEGT